MAGLLFLAAAISWFQDNKILFCAELAAAVLALCLKSGPAETGKAV